MIRVVAGLLPILHGIVHLIYLGQAQRYYEMQAGMIWPDGSWLFSRLVGEKAVRSLAALGCLLAAVGFVGAGVGVLANLGWWRPVVVIAAATSTAVFVAFWDGKLHKLGERGLFGILINIAVLLLVLVFRWPSLHG
jgi:hypothetical protein